MISVFINHTRDDIRAFLNKKKLAYKNIENPDSVILEDLAKQNNIFENRTGASASAIIVLRGNWSAPDTSQSSNTAIINNTFDQSGSLSGGNGAIFLTDLSSNNIVRNNLPVR